MVFVTGGAPGDDRTVVSSRSVVPDRIEGSHETALSGDTALSDGTASSDGTALFKGTAPPDGTALSDLTPSDPDGTSLPTMAGGTPPVSAAASPGPDTGPLTPGQPFGTRYHIIRTLGVGGMGAVYHAWDVELAEAVAIKVIRPEAMADPLAAQELERRFKRELQLARQVTHKNVIRIHDLGETKGIRYITMSYVEGTDLATLLKQQGPLDVKRTLAIIRPVLAGLLAAHKAGVVHRDLKPANIMVGTNGEAYLMDFGIARSVTSAAPSADPQPAAALPLHQNTLLSSVGGTMAGAVLGTIRYMAPEQAEGKEVDQRADVYAMGLIIYDMLAGARRQENSTSAVAELETRKVKAPRALRTILPAVPEPVSQIVTRCLEPDPANRYQTSEALIADIEKLDENGVPLPLVRRLTPRMVAAAAVVAVAMAAATYEITRRFVTPPPEHEPVSVLIADFENQTGDVAFDRTLESVMKLALEGAGFITAYDRAGVGALGDVAPARLDEPAAQQIAVKQGVGIVVSGSLARQGNGYNISIKALEPVTGNVVTTASSRAPNRNAVLSATANLATDIRQALGDETSDSSQLFAQDTLSATSLPVVRQYALATEAWSNARYEEALQAFSRSVEMDPSFGMGYQGLAQVSRNLDRPQDAEKYIKEALRYVDGMTERERFRARGFFYRITGDYPACVREYGDLIARYAADVAARNQLALCSTFLRDMPRAVEEMRQVVKILPQSIILRGNLALYESYSGNFEAGEREALAVREQRVFPLLALAFGQLGQGKLADATRTYRELTTLNAQGASYAATGLGDLAAYEGRFAEAVATLQAGANADLAARNPDRAAVKFAAIAHAHLSRGQKGPAAAAAERALNSSQTLSVRFLAARSLVEADRIERARAVAKSLAADVASASQAHARIIEGLISLSSGNSAEAIRLLNEANGMLDTWIGHFDLGRAYFEAGQFIQADSEFDRCLKRRGEALALFLDEHPSYSYLPPVYYYQGRVREALNSAGFAESYRTYLSIRGRSTQDPLVPDLRRRAG